MFLNQQERDKFAAWCDKEAIVDESMSTQLEKLGPAHKPMVDRMRLRAKCYQVVSQRLKGIETVEVENLVK